MSQTVQLNLRIDAGLAAELERIARQEALRKTELVRKYLIEGIRRWRLNHAISRYQARQITLERAAADAGLSIYEVMDELRSRSIFLDQTSPEEAREEVRALVAEMAVSG